MTTVDSHKVYLDGVLVSWLITNAASTLASTDPDSNDAEYSYGAAEAYEQAASFVAGFLTGDQVPPNYIATQVRRRVARLVASFREEEEE